MIQQIQFGNITLRQAEAADAEQLAAWWNDGAVMAHAGFPYGLGTTAQAVLDGMGAGQMVIQEDGRLIGECSYRDAGKGAAEIGIKICRPKCQNRGIGKLVLRLLISQLFQSGYSRIVLSTDPANTRARHVYESLGFRCVKIARDSWTDQLGHLRSSVEYELSEHDFFFARNQDAERGQLQS